jgi:hypothetical protein
VSARMHAAASSIASGTPSSARQIARDIRCVRRRHLETADRPPAPGREELHGRRGEDVLDGRRAYSSGNASGFEFEHALAAHAQPRATRHEECAPGTSVSSERRRSRLRAPARSCRGR